MTPPHDEIRPDARRRAHRLPGRRRRPARPRLRPGFVSHLEHLWEEPPLARFLERLASFSPLILFDKRGTGLSDRVPSASCRRSSSGWTTSAPSWTPPAPSARRCSGVRGRPDGDAVRRDLSGARRRRSSSIGTCARTTRCARLPVGTDRRRSATRRSDADRATTGAKARSARRSSRRAAPTTSAFAALVRQALSGWRPARALRGAARMTTEIDVRDVLPRSACRRSSSTGRTTDVPVEPRALPGRAHPGRRGSSSCPGDDHCSSSGDGDAVLDEVEEFLTGARRQPRARPRAGDRAVHRHRRLDRARRRARRPRAGASCSTSHDGTVRRQLERFRGREVKTTGDGFLATFDGPARAIALRPRDRRRACARSASRSAPACTPASASSSATTSAASPCTSARASRSAAGPARCSSRAPSRTSSSGSGIAFADRGAHALKGVPGEWRLFAVA